MQQPKAISPTLFILSARQNKDYYLLLEEFVFVPVMDAVVVGVILEFERPE